MLLGAMQLVKNPLVTLDVYSSCEIYGKDFYKETINNLNKHLTTQERSKLRTAITTYLELEDVSKESFPNETWLTPSIMESIVNSHESEFKEVLPSYGIKAEALLDYSEVENQRRFQGVSEETYNSFLKAIFKRNV